MSDPAEVNLVHFIQMQGATDAQIESVSDNLSNDLGMEKDDNIIVTSEMIEPMTREEALYVFEELAEALDVVNEVDINWEQVYEEEDRLG
jgi:hypothetical protein